MPLHRPDADDAHPEIEEPSCRGRHGGEIWGIQPEVIHHSSRVACTEANRTLEEGEHLRMFILTWHPKDLTDIPRRQPDQLDPIQSENRLEVAQPAFALDGGHNQGLFCDALGESWKVGRCRETA